ncbi:MAG: histone deacetylase family protein [Alphaproteobacteria bacterium]|nr:histone deacetylase family protein [Alphaproteobacteria bacterium]
MLGFVSHPDCLLHDAGDGHPESAERIYAIQNHLIVSNLEFVLHHYDAPLATRDQLAAAHDGAYVDQILAQRVESGYIHLDGDTTMSPGTLQAALRAAGAGVHAVDLVMAGTANPVFCAVRPPGHHAERGKAMGFCLFDNIAVAAAHALNKYGIERIAIIDFDVHHGNGTEDIFRDDPRVLFCSSFQHPFYPFTGHEKVTKNLIDVPLAAGATGAEFQKAVTELWMPALDAFRPQFLFISAGFDAHVFDDMSDIQLTEGDYTWVTQRMVEIAKRHAQGRIVSMLEGGYEPDSLARSVAAHLKALLD